jgi:hypothetical protein
MRIAKEINLNDIKVTIMVMSGKYTIKLEKNLLEQTYKFRDGSGLDSVEKIEALFTPEFYKQTNAIFYNMTAIRKEALINNMEEEKEFDVII